MIDLKDTNIILTGATGGIGNSILENLFFSGANVLATGTNEEKLIQIKEKYKNVQTEKFDISNHSEIEDFINKANDSLGGKIDVLINNAGITEDGLIFRMKNDQWSKVLQTNLNSNYQIIKSLLPNMLSKKYGKIIGISSIVASTGNPGQANYVASKSGMIGLYKSIASEVAKRNINVNVISPGFISTNMTENLNDQQKQTYLSRIPMSRFGKPEDIANLVYFLATEDSSYITGQNFHVNGGMLMV